MTKTNEEILKRFTLKMKKHGLLSEVLLARAIEQLSQALLAKDKAHREEMIELASVALNDIQSAGARISCLEDGWYSARFSFWKEKTNPT